MSTNIETNVPDFTNLTKGFTGVFPADRSDHYRAYRKPTDSAFFNCALPSELLNYIVESENVYDLTDSDVYVDYLGKIEDTHLKNHGLFAHKAKIQLECRKLGINDENTRIIDPHDLGTLIHYTKHLISLGRTVWIGSSTIDDMTDPQTGKENVKNKSITPPLYRKGINTLEDLYAVLPSINVFKSEHPDMLLKVFPQDMEKPTLTSIVFADNEKERKISFHFRPGKYTPKGERDDSSDQPIDIDVDFNGDIPLIYVNSLDDLDWLEIALASEDIFEKINKINFGSSPVVNIELMHLDNHKKLDFVTDIIYGDGDQTVQYPPIKFVEMLKLVKTGMVVQRKSKFDPKEFIHNQGLLARRIVDLLESNQKHYHSHAPTKTEIVATFANLADHDYKILEDYFNNGTAASDISVQKYLESIARYLSNDQYRIVSQYLTYTQITKRPTMHSNLMDHVKACLETKYIEDEITIKREKANHDQELAQNILDLLDRIDLIKSNFAIAPSIFRTLSKIANSNIPSESITKALLAMRNRFSLSKNSINADKLQLNQSSDWIFA